MPTFAYRAVDAAGRRTRGRLSGTTSAAVTLELESRGLLPLEVQEAAERDNTGGFGFRRRSGVLEFTRSVAALLPAGMPLARALKAATVAAPEALRPSFDSVRARVERGDELASALADHPRLFSPLYIGIVRAGEKSGALDGAFERLAQHLEREDELRSKLVSMSIYPALLAVVGAAAILVLVLFVLPRFADLLLTSGASLPRFTALVLSVAMAAQASWRWLLLIPIALLLLLLWLRRSNAGRQVAANLLVRVPVAGSWRRQALAAAFARMVGELLSGGAPLLNALSDARDCMSDPVARNETDRIRTRVREGSSLNAAIGEKSAIPRRLAPAGGFGRGSGAAGGIPAQERRSAGTAHRTRGRAHGGAGRTRHDRGLRRSGGRGRAGSAAGHLRRQRGILPVTSVPKQSRVGNQKGFTLVEVIVVLIILAAMAALAVPAFRRVVQEDDMTVATRQLEALFKLARDSAIKSGMPVTVWIDSVSSGVWLVGPAQDTASVAAAATATTGLRAVPGEPLDLPAAVRIELTRTRSRFRFTPAAPCLPTR